MSSDLEPKNEVSSVSGTIPNTEVKPVTRERDLNDQPRDVEAETSPNEGTQALLRALEGQGVLGPEGSQDQTNEGTNAPGINPYCCRLPDHTPPPGFAYRTCLHQEPVGCRAMVPGYPPKPLFSANVGESPCADDVRPPVEDTEAPCHEAAETVRNAEADPVARERDLNDQPRDVEAETSPNEETVRNAEADPVASERDLNDQPRDVEAETSPNEETVPNAEAEPVASERDLNDQPRDVEAESSPNEDQETFSQEYYDVLRSLWSIYGSSSESCRRHGGVHVSQRGKSLAPMNPCVFPYCAQLPVTLVPPPGYTYCECQPQDGAVTLPEASSPAND